MLIRLPMLVRDRTGVCSLQVWWGVAQLTQGHEVALDCVSECPEAAAMAAAAPLVAAATVGAAPLAVDGTLGLGQSAWSLPWLPA